jgi:hypothetical protein
MVQKEEQVRKAWEMAKQYISGQRRMYISTVGNLAPSFGKELLDDIARLKKISEQELEVAIENVRGKLNICQAMGLFGASDLELINAELDKIT